MCGNSLSSLDQSFADYWETLQLLHDSDDINKDETYLSEVLAYINELGNHELETTDADMSVYKTYHDMFEACHGGKMLHGGVRRTWLLLNKIFPGHKVPFCRIADIVDECAICQKFRRGMSDALKPVEKHLEPEQARHIVGMDTVTMLL